MTNKCFGSCEEHVGKVQYVSVKDPKTGYDWGEFYYCEYAIECDTKNGLIVTILDENDWKERDEEIESIRHSQIERE